MVNTLIKSNSVTKLPMIQVLQGKLAEPLVIRVQNNERASERELDNFNFSASERARARHFNFLAKNFELCYQCWSSVTVLTFFRTLTFSLTARLLQHFNSTKILTQSNSFCFFSLKSIISHILLWFFNPQFSNIYVGKWTLAHLRAQL